MKLQKSLKCLRSYIGVLFLVFNLSIRGTESIEMDFIRYYNKHSIELYRNAKALNKPNYFFNIQLGAEMKVKSRISFYCGLNLSRLKVPFDAMTWHYQYNKEILLRHTLRSNENVTLRATDEIKLNHGFTAPSGTELKLIPTPCN